MIEKRLLPAGAKSLLQTLQSGDHVAVPSVYVHSLAFSDHATLYFDNAVAICRLDGKPDYRIFTALYNMRHGMELWLKCLVRNHLIDRFLSHSFRFPKSTVEEVGNALKLSKKQGSQFQQTLCCLRNTLVDEITYPDKDPWKECSGPIYAQEGLDFMRKNPSLQRFYFAAICRVQIAGHDLSKLWDGADSLLRSYFYDAERASELGGEEKTRQTPQEIRALCQLLHHYDPRGDAFRYPTSPQGDWYMDLPHMNLNRLRVVAQNMADTVRAIDSVRSQQYECTDVSGRTGSSL